MVLVRYSLDLEQVFTKGVAKQACGKGKVTKEAQNPAHLLKDYFHEAQTLDLKKEAGDLIKRHCQRTQNHLEHDDGHHVDGESGGSIEKGGMFKF